VGITGKLQKRISVNTADSIVYTRIASTKFNKDSFLILKVKYVEG